MLVRDGARAEVSLTLTSRSGQGATTLVLNCRDLGLSKAPGKAKTCSFSPCLPQFPHQEMGCCIGTPQPSHSDISPWLVEQQEQLRLEKGTALSEMW